MNGILNIYKEKGYTSHDVVAKLRRILKTKKIGHTGTLDPNAEGVLPICIGQATKVSELLMDKSKGYWVRFELGITTDTQDIWGNILEKKEVFVGLTEVSQTINSFLGAIQQIPPMYSAIKQDGKKLYELARAGITVERKARDSVIHEIKELKEVGKNTYEMVVSCSKGTYIRTLCFDIGEKLGCGACMTALTRIQSGKFELNTALRLEEVEKLQQNNQLEEYLSPIEKVFSFKNYHVVEEFQKWLYAGNPIPLDKIAFIENSFKENLAENYRNNKELVYGYDFKGNLVGIYSLEKDCLKVVKFLASEEKNDN